MKLAALISGGKDSWYAAFLATKRTHEIACIVTIEPESSESYMFHFPNAKFTREQAKAADLPIISLPTAGIKEQELKDLKEALNLAKQKYHIEGIVSGAIASNYQKERIQNLADEMELKSLTPLWGINSVQYSMGLMGNNFEVIIVGIAADKMDESWLGRPLDKNSFAELEKLGINPVGEGGEYESFVLDCPLFKKKLQVWDHNTIMENEFTGKLLFEEVQVIKK